MPKWLRIVVVIVVLAGAFFFWKRREANTHDPNRVILSGNVEITHVDLAFKISGRLQERLVDEGQSVIAQQVIARLDAADQQVRVDQAQAELAYAEAVLREVVAGSRPEEINQTKAQLAQVMAAAQAARNRLDLAIKDLARYQALLDQKVISQRLFDEVRTGYKTAVNANAEAAAQVARAQATDRLVQTGPRLETIEQAQARVLVSQKALDMARLQLANTILTAPFTGVALSKAAEPGAYLNPGSPVITLGRMDQVWLRAFINETDLGRIKLNQDVEVRTDSYPDKTYVGRVSYISDQAEFTPKNVQTFEERVKLMYRVKIALDNPHGELKAGMPADAMLVIHP